MGSWIELIRVCLAKHVCRCYVVECLARQRPPTPSIVLLLYDQPTLYHHGRGSRVESPRDVSQRSQSHSALRPTEKHLLPAATIQVEPAAYDHQRSTALAGVPNLLPRPNRYFGCARYTSLDFRLWFFDYQSYRPAWRFPFVTISHLYSWAKEDATKSSHRIVMQSSY
jgi:hypothetical protein